jgi:hypothetical protein
MGLITKEEVTSVEHLFLEKYEDGQKEAGEMPYEVIMVSLRTVGDYQQEIGGELLHKPEDIRIAMAYAKNSGTVVAEKG